MPAGTRLIAPLETVAFRATGARYVCLTCRRRFIPSSAPRSLIYQTRRHNSDLPFSEKVRRKIWGTDSPPGAKDPYVGESPLERQAREDPEAQLAESEAQPVSQPGEYVPATTWDGLEHVGTSGEWWEYPPNHEDYVAPFLKDGPAETREQMLTLLHQATVELCLMTHLNKTLNEICNVWEHEPRILALLSQVEVTPSNQPGIDALVFPSEDVKTNLVEYFNDLNQVDPEAIPSESQSTNQDTELQIPQNLDFLSMPLGDPAFKFSFLKRASQLIGYRVPDPEISSITKISNVLRVFSTEAKPKPSKLADVLIAEGKFAALPNVKIFDRRQTPIDHEKEVGRWKVIEDELTKRGLPVTGRATS